jgi:hypothetical protein
MPADSISLLMTLALAALPLAGLAKVLLRHP